MMKILMAVHHFPPTYTGGAENRTLRTAAAMQERGHQVKVVCVESIHRGPENGVDWVDDDYKGVDVRRLSFDLNKVPDRHRWEYDNPWVGDHLNTMIAEWQPELFHLIGGYLLTSSVLNSANTLGVPSVVSLTDFWFICPRITMLRTNGDVSDLPIDSIQCVRCLGEAKRSFRWFGRYFPWLAENYWRRKKSAIIRHEMRIRTLVDRLNRVDAILAPSRFIRSMYVDAGIEPSRIIFSRQGMDITNMPAHELRKNPTTHLRLGYIGQIDQHKGVHVLLQALDLMKGKPLSLHVYGDMNHSPKYSKRLKEKYSSDRRIHFAGTFNGRSHLGDIYKDLDVVVVPSIWYENSPNVILEAQIFRTPVIASNLGGMAELVQDEENGLLFKTGDPRSLQQQILRIEENPHLLNDLRSGITPVRTLTEEMDELDGIYHSVLANNKLGTEAVN